MAKVGTGTVAIDSPQRPNGVSKPVAYPVGYTVTQLDRRAVSMVWDERRQRIYFSSFTDAQGDAGTISGLDPATAQVLSTVTSPTAPGRPQPGRLRVHPVGQGRNPPLCRRRLEYRAHLLHVEGGSKGRR